MATTFAIVAVFVPIAFMSGIIGRFFFQFGVTVAVAVLVSLFVSFTLDPMLSSVWHDPPGSRFARVPWLGRFMDRVERGIEWLHAVYGRDARVGARPPQERARASRCVVVPRELRASCRWSAPSSCRRPTRASSRCGSTRRSGSSLEYTDGKVRQVEAVLKAFPEIALAMTTVGTEDGRNYARVNLKLVDRARARRGRRRSSSARSATALKPIPGHRARVRLRPADLGQPARPRSRRR